MIALSDASLTIARQQGFLETQDGQMLDYTARNSDDRRIIYRFPTPESDAAFRSYLRTLAQAWRSGHTGRALDYQTQRYGFSRYTWVDELSLRSWAIWASGRPPPQGLIGGPPYSPINLRRRRRLTAPDGTPINLYQMWPNAGDPCRAAVRLRWDYEPQRGTGFFAVILHPPHYFTPSWVEIVGTYGMKLAYIGILAQPMGIQGQRKDDSRRLRRMIADYRASGLSLRHIVVDFAGDCVDRQHNTDGIRGQQLYDSPSLGTF